MLPSDTTRVSASPDRPYHLPDHVYACQTDEGIVFLDTRHDRYFGLGSEHVASIGELVHGWPRRGSGRTDYAAIPLGALRDVTQALVQRGLLAEGAPRNNRLPRISVPPLTKLPPRLTTTRYRPARPVDVANFVAACSRAAWCLKWGSLESIVSGLITTRQTLETRGVRRPGDAMELAALFRRLRSLFFSEKNRCLFNALSLAYFLRRYRHFPLWVVGVKTAPFAAHSWVQSEHIVLDGDPATICHFVPILAA